MKKKTMVLGVVLLAVMGCIPPSNISPEGQTRLESAEKQLASLLEDKKTVSEHSETIAGIAKDLAAAKEAGVGVKDALLFGAAGGVGARTLLHGVSKVAPFLPGPWGLVLSSLCSLVLGGSATRKKETPTV